MNGRNLYTSLFIWFCILSLATNSFSQTITTGSITPASVCPGGTVIVSFTVSGTFAAANTFSAQLSDAAGTFSAGSPVIGSIASTTAAAISATIPAATPNGTGYKIRVVSSNAPITGTPSTQALSVNVPSAPGTAAVGYCVGQTASALTAVPSTGGILNWYGTAATGGTASSVSPTPSTTAVGSTVYYVSQTVNGCESARAIITVTVSSAPAAPMATPPAPYCQGVSAAALVATPSAGATLNWYGTNATGGTATGAAPVPNTAAAGTTTYYVSQQIGACESPRTGIVVVVNPAPSAPATTPAPAYCQGAPAAALVATPSAGGALNWYGTAATGGTASTTATTPNTAAPGITNYYVSQTSGGCEGPRASIAVTVNSTPGSPSVAAVNLCQNSAAGPLTATPSAGGVLNWYGTAATGGTASGMAPTPSSATPGATIYYVSQSVNGCEGPRTSITVTVGGLPAVPATTAPAPYCQNTGAAALIATPSAGGVLNWYGTAATGGTASSVAPTPSTTAAGTIVYYVSQSVSGCEGLRASITVTIKPTPAAPATTPAPAYCQGAPAAALVATPSAGGALNWYGTAATGGTASTTATTPGTTSPGTIAYYVSQTIDGCEGPRASITVTVNSTPTSPAVAAVNLCQNSAAGPLTATPSAGGVLNWYGTAATGGTASPTAPTPPTTAVGLTNYYVSQSVNNCEGPRASMAVTIKAVPVAPTATASPTYCQGASAAALVATPSAGGVLNWYGTAATGGTASSAAAIPSTTAAGTIVYYVSQSVNGCEGPRASITVTVKPTPAAPVVAPVAFCHGDIPPVLTATLVPNAIANWYSTNPNSGTPTAGAPVPSNTVDGITNYYVSQTLDGCESGLGAPAGRAALAVRVKPLPAAPTVAPIGFCNNAPSAPLTASGTNLTWYDPAGTTLGGAAPTPGTGTVGDQVFKVSATTENCEGPKADLVVTIKPLPRLPGVTDLAYCLATQDQPKQMIPPLTAFGESLRWFNTDGNEFTGTPTPDNTRVGTQTYRVSQTFNGCESGKATLVVTIQTTPMPTVAKPLVIYCINDKAVPLEATAAAGASLRWVNPYEQVTVEAPAPLTQNTNVRPGGDPFYVYQIGQNGCYSERAVTKVIVNGQPTLSLKAPVTTVNLGQRINLELQFTSSGPYSYTLSDGTSGVSTQADTVLSLLPRATTTYQIVAVKNACGVGLSGNPATATIAVRVPTVTTSALTTSTLCAGASLTVPFITTGAFNPGNLFRLELVSVADTSKKTAIPATATTSPITAPFPSTVVAGQYYVRVKADNPEIAIIGQNSPTLLTVRPQPAATLTGTQRIYEGYPASLTLTLAGESPWMVTYADSVRSYSATATSSPYALEVRPSRSTSYTLVSVANVCGNGPVSGVATVTVSPLLGVDPSSLDPLVKTYPVPTTAILTVELDLPLTRSPATLSLTDGSGRPVLQQTTRNRKEELDLTSQPSGLYFLRIQVGDRQTVRKVLKQ